MREKCVVHFVIDIFLPSFLGVHVILDPDHLLAGTFCFASTFEMQSVLLPLSIGEDVG